MPDRTVDPADVLDVLADLIAERVAEKLAARAETPDEADAWLATKEAAMYLGVHADTLRGLAAEGRIPSEQERALAFVLQQVWFASLIGWASGLHGRGVIVDQVATAAGLLLREPVERV